MRKRVFGIIELSRDGERLGGLYDAVMTAVILLSMVPLSFKESNGGFVLIERAAAAIFILDYLLRLWTADLKLGKGWRSFLLYPFTPMALVDLLAVLPTFFAVAAGLRLAKLLRLFRTFRVFRSFKMFRYSRSFEIIAGVIRDQRGPLLAVGTLAVGYVLVSALVIFNVEPDTFGTFFDAVYWATVSLTTMGYGDIYPVTTVGRMVTMLSAFVGIAIVALPSGIITAGYMDRLRDGR